MLRFEIDDVEMNSYALERIEGLKFDNRRLRYNGYYYNYYTRPDDIVVKIFTDDYLASFRDVKEDEVEKIKLIKEEWYQYLYNLFLLADEIKNLIV